MLEAMALCVVVKDWHTLRMTYLPEPMQEKVEAELGFDPWKWDLSEALGIAAEGNPAVALRAIQVAERQMLAMTSEEFEAAFTDCVDRYGFIAEESK